MVFLDQSVLWWWVANPLMGLLTAAYYRYSPSDLDRLFGYVCEIDILMSFLAAGYLYVFAMPYDRCYNTCEELLREEDVEPDCCNGGNNPLSSSSKLIIDFCFWSAVFNLVRWVYAIIPFSRVKARISAEILAHNRFVLRRSLVSENMDVDRLLHFEQIFMQSMVSPKTYIVPQGSVEHLLNVAASKKAKHAVKASLVVDSIMDRDPDDDRRGRARGSSARRVVGSKARKVGAGGKAKMRPMNSGGVASRIYGRLLGKKGRDASKKGPKERKGKGKGKGREKEREVQRREVIPTSGKFLGMGGGGMSPAEKVARKIKAMKIMDQANAHQEHLYLRAHHSSMRSLKDPKAAAVLSSSPLTGMLMWAHLGYAIGWYYSLAITLMNLFLVYRHFVAEVWWEWFLIVFLDGAAGTLFLMNLISGESSMMNIVIAGMINTRNVVNMRKWASRYRVLVDIEGGSISPEEASYIVDKVKGGLWTEEGQQILHIRNAFGSSFRDIVKKRTRVVHRDPEDLNAYMVWFSKTVGDVGENEMIKTAKLLSAV